MMDAILSDLDYRKTKWRLRRGLLELDILLENFAEKSLRQLRNEELHQLNQCLDLADNDFLELIIKKKSAEKLFGSSNEALQSLLNKIRTQVEVKECND